MEKKKNKVNEKRVRGTRDSSGARKVEPIREEDCQVKNKMLEKGREGLENKSKALTLKMSARNRSTCRYALANEGEALH